ncbi:MAG: SIS domain-containing protein [Anaerolineae bacterium]
MTTALVRRHAAADPEVMSMATTAFLTEVAEQPEALHRLVNHYRREGAPQLARWREMALASKRTVFVGMGTSEFSAELVLAALARQGVDATTLDAGELLHYPRPLPGTPVLVSQSGESVETRKVAEGLRQRQGMVTITNEPDSTIARLVELVLPIVAGHESAITNKTYVNTLAVLLLMAALEPGQVEPTLDRLSRLADAMPRYDSEGLSRAASLLAQASVIQFIARGPSIAAAKQAALTFSEGTKTPAYALAAGAFRHGPFELVGPNLFAVFFVPDGPTYGLMTSMAIEIVEKGGHVVAITDRPFALAPERSQVLAVPGFGEDAFPLIASTTQELLLDALARERGIVAGDFLHGGKVTTRE